MQTAPQFPDPVAAGQTLAKLNDWRAIMTVLIFVIIALMVFIVWREWNLVRLVKAIDKMSAAMWAWRLALAEDRAERRAEREQAQAERIAHEDRETRL